MTPELNERFWELDLIRGVALLMMGLYHLVYDLEYLAALSLNVHAGFWLYFAHATATLFLLLVGISLTLSYSRALRVKGPKQNLALKYGKRGLTIFGWGLVITFTTWLLLKDGVVVWGILHLIGLSILLAYPLLQLRRINLVLGLLLLALGIVLKQVAVGYPWLLWLGLTPEHFHSLDYFPLLPWFGVVLIGVFLGNSLYPQYTRTFHLEDRSHVPVIRRISFLGRHSLAIYLLHQPVLIAVLYLLGLVDTGFLTFP
jgi:uncharacterized membrane protein